MDNKEREIRERVERGQYKGCHSCTDIPFLLEQLDAAQAAHKESQELWDAQCKESADLRAKLSQAEANLVADRELSKRVLQASVVDHCHAWANSEASLAEAKEKIEDLQADLSRRDWARGE